jgi:hypothetical protein
MEQNKFYIPDISEFYVGFEYEFQEQFMVDDRSETDWRKEKIEFSGYIQYIDEYLEEDRIRVKYLDKEDIESLGFKSIDPNPLNLFNLNKYNYNITTYKIVTSGRIGENGFPEEEIKEEGFVIYKSYLGSVLFKGNIKNKSELIKILKMIGV